MDEQEQIKKLLAQQAKNLEDNRNHARIYAEHKSGKLIFPEIRWHLDAATVDLSLQNQRFVEELFIGGISIIPSVDIELLLDDMRPDDGAWYRQKILYRYPNERQISRIIHEWSTGINLIPPTIMIFDEEHCETTKDKLTIITKYLQPVDGKHRLRTAYCLGAKEIPILVRTVQLEKIKRILSIQ